MTGGPHSEGPPVSWFSPPLSAGISPRLLSLYWGTVVSQTSARCEIRN